MAEFFELLCRGTLEALVQAPTRLDALPICGKRTSGWCWPCGAASAHPAWPLDPSRPFSTVDCCPPAARRDTQTQDTSSGGTVEPSMAGTIRQRRPLLKSEPTAASTLQFASAPRDKNGEQKEGERANKRRPPAKPTTALRRASAWKCCRARSAARRAAHVDRLTKAHETPLRESEPEIARTVADTVVLGSQSRSAPDIRREQ